MKISALPAAGSLDGTEVAAVVQAGGTVKATAAAIANLFKGTKGTDIASAATTNIGAATGVFVHITGTTTITAFDTVAAGITRLLIFDGILTLTHDGTPSPSLKLPGNANITTAAGDTALFVSEGSGDWVCVAYWRKSGRPLKPANIPQRIASAATTTTLADMNGHILHPSSDSTARTFTIDSNANMAAEIGDAVTFVNQNGAGVVTIAITSDTMRLAGAGTTGNRTLAANGVATALKIAATEWIISGVGLT